MEKKGVLLMHRLVWLVYNILFFVGYLLILPHFLLRMWRRGGYRKGFFQRIGFYEADIIECLRKRSRLWIHAVSVGEVYVALRFIAEMRAIEPGSAFVLTTTTSTGHRIAEAGLHEDDVLLYFPADFPWVLSGVLKRIKPRALILTESELWPNLIRMTKGRGIPVILINGRISMSSYRGYRFLGVFFRRIIKCFDLILVQTEKDKERLLELGGEQGKIRVMGTAKYDIIRSDAIGEKEARQALISCGFGDDDVVIVGGSTWPGEEDILLGIYKRLREEFKRLKLVIVPRHAERHAQIALEIQKHGLAFIRRSVLVPEDCGVGAGTVVSENAGADVLLVDTTGELKNFYACAAIIFVGKSLTNHGGQNIIEAAASSKAIIVGPYMENFADVVSDFVSANALMQVADADQLEQSIRLLINDLEVRESYGRHAGEVVMSKRGVVRNSVRVIMECLNLDVA